jgi:NADPH-dependent 2,4-dienoyl-CoA reductase/sulfur reductase-like enzyme
MARGYAIVGSGIAGLAAAEAIRQREPNAIIQMVSEESHDFYSRPGLAYLLRGDIPEKQLFIRNVADLRALQLNRVTARVRDLGLDRRELILDDGDRLPYDRLLLATGAAAAPPPFPGGDLGGVVKLDSLDDARRILKSARRGKTAIVVGGGITALELVEGLHARRMRVHYLMRSDRYWSDVLDEVESRIVLNRLRHEGVTVHVNTQVKEAFGRRGWVSGIETQDGGEIDCDLLAVAIGVKSRIELAKLAGLILDRGVLVDEFLQTSMPGVFAAGDVAQVRDPQRGLLPMDVLWPTALEQGRIAGANMTGERIPYVKGVPFNVTQLAGLKVTIIGAVGKGKKDDDLVTIARGDSQAWRLLTESRVVADRDDVNRVRLMIGDRTIVGALVMGDQTWSRPMERLITEKVEITPIRPALLDGGAEALTRLAEFYRQWEATR